MSERVTSITLASRTAVPSWTRQLLHGRPYAIVPVVALVGDIVVRPLGSEAPEFVPGPVLERSAALWNGRPVVYVHPPAGAATANEPAVLQSQQIGLMFNARYEGGRLKADLWLDLTRTEVGDNIVEALLNADTAEPLEVSIGATVYSHRETGTHLGKQYEVVWDRIEPDHLAVLPIGMPGACPVAAGCGAPRYAQEAAVATTDLAPTEAQLAERRSTVERFFDHLRSFFAAMGDIAPAVAAPATDEPAAEPPAVETPAELAVSAPESVLPPADVAPVASSTGGESTPVAVAAQAEAGPTTTTGGDCMCVTTELAGQLIANSAAPFQESHRASLEALGEAALRSLAEKYTAAAPAAEPSTAPAPATPPAEPSQPATAALSALTPEQFLAMAPPEVRQLVAAAQAATQARRTTVLAALQGKTAFPQARLEAMEVADLEALAQTLRVSPAHTIDYSLAGVAPAPAQLAASDAAVYLTPPNGWAKKEGGN